MIARWIKVQIIGDARGLRRALMQAELRLSRSWRRRLALKVALWRIDREADPS